MPTASGPGGMLTVLHVEDDPALAALVRKALGRRGYGVVHVATGDAALERLKQGGIDVVALDHSLGGETGLDILARLVPGDLRPPIVYVTGSADARLAVEALKNGADDYVIKDMSSEFYDLLVAALEQAIERARLKREQAENQRLIRESRDRAEILLREVNHRVANSLGLVAAMVRMQSASIEDEQARRALQKTESRIAAVAGVHRHLYTSENVGEVEISEYLRLLLEELEASMRGHASSCRIVTDLVSVSVKTDRAVSLGVVVGELVTNAFKYAYPCSTGGEIRVRVRFDGARIKVLIEDDGIGWSGGGAAQGTGLGSKIVTAMGRTLDAVLTWEARSPGTTVVIDFPAG